jgi:hypothetical protein
MERSCSQLAGSSVHSGTCSAFRTAFPALKCRAIFFRRCAAGRQKPPLFVCRTKSFFEGRKNREFLKIANGLKTLAKIRFFSPKMRF